MIYKHFTKEQIQEFEIEDTGGTFASTIAIFKHQTGVVLFDILDNQTYKVHPASHADFLDIHEKHLSKNAKVK
ncbi:MAG: hypothetical protein WCO66_01940 [Candidatus Absconditabacteria bacterium]